MERTKKAKRIIAENKSVLLDELVDLLTAAAEITREIGAGQFNFYSTDGKLNVHYYDYSRFPFEGDGVRKRTVNLGDDREREEVYIEFDGVIFSCFVPKGV